MSRLSYPLLLGIQGIARTFYRFDVSFVHAPPPDPWRDLRVVAILNHTSLYEPLLAGGVPRALMKRIAHYGVVPIAEKTLKRPLVGHFFRLVAPDVVAVTRLRDASWQELVDRIEHDSVLTIAPEGRMKRPTGLDSEGNPMTVRGGIADLLRAISGGTMVLAHSGGLHHVQAPGEHVPRAFKMIRMRIELLDIATYREQLMAESVRDPAKAASAFKLAVIKDLETRRDRYVAEMEALDRGEKPATDGLRWPARGGRPHHVDLSPASDEEIAAASTDGASMVARTGGAA